MLRIFFLCLPVLLLTGPAIGQTAEPFPGLIAETLEGNSVSLPDHTIGKYTLLGLAWSRKSEDELRTWYSPVVETFISKGTGMLAAFNHDIHVYFIPMFTGINAAVAGPARKAALKNTNPVLQPHILFYRGDMKPYRGLLTSESRDLPFFFLLDKQGTIIYTTSGAWSQEKMDEIEALIE